MRAVKILAVLVALLVAGLVFRIGWELPVQTTCSGDVCLAKSPFEIDWARVNWAVKPTRIACFEANPAAGSPLIGPGDVCVRAHGDGSQEHVTYQQLQADIQRRRSVTLIAVVAALLLIPAAAFIRRNRSKGGRDRQPG